MPQNVAKYCLDLFTVPHFVAIVIKSHKVWHFGGAMNNEIVYVKTRLQVDLHKKLKAYGQEDNRSMNYLINQAIKQFLQKKESAKA